MPILKPRATPLRRKGPVSPAPEVDSPIAKSLGSCSRAGTAAERGGAWAQAPGKPLQTTLASDETPDCPLVSPRKRPEKRAHWMRTAAIALETEMHEIDQAPAQAAKHGVPGGFCRRTWAGRERPLRRL